MSQLIHQDQQIQSIDRLIVSTVYLLLLFSVVGLWIRRRRKNCPKIDDWILGIRKDWPHLQVESQLRKAGLCLSASNDRQSATDSLIVCLIQQLSGRYSTLIQIQDAVESILENESDQIRFRLGLSKTHYQPNIKLKPFIQKVLSHLQKFADCGFTNKSTITVYIENRIVKIRSKDGKELHLWQDGTSGLFSCVIQRKNMFDDVEDYAMALLRDVPLNIYDLLFKHLERIEDDDVEKAVTDLSDELQSCQIPADYLAVMIRCTKDDRWRLIPLEQLVDIGDRLPEATERDLREEIFDCLARAAENTNLRRKRDYETACQNDLERANEKERHNRQLKEEMEAAEKEIALVEAQIKEQKIMEAEVGTKYQNQQSKANEKRDRELQAKKQLDQKTAESKKQLDELRKKKSETEAEIRRIKNEENRALEKAKEVSKNLKYAGIELDWVQLAMKSRREQLEDGQENLARLEEKQRQLALQEKQLMADCQSKTDRKNQEWQKLNSNQTRIQELKIKKGQNAWREFQIALAGSIPPYQLVVQKSSFIQQVKKINRLDRLFELVKTEFKLNLKNFGDLVAYAQIDKIPKDQIMNETRNIVLDLLAEPKNDFIRQPWRVTGDVILLSQVRNQMPNKKHCQEIQICSSRVIYIDCDWTIPGVNVILSAPRIQVIGERRQISTSGRDAPEFSNKQASNAVRNGENGDHGMSGAAGESAGNFLIYCAHLSGGNLHVVANGGKGADGQDGGDGGAGTNGFDGNDGVIRDRPSEGIGIINAAIRPSDELKRFARGQNGSPGLAGGSGGNGGAGGEGGNKGTINRTITKTWQNNFTSSAKDGQDGQDGNPGQGAPGGWGGLNGRDRALVFQPCEGVAVTGSWKEDCGDLYLQPVHNPFGCILGFWIFKKGDNKGRASCGAHGENGTRANQRQRATAKTKQQITNVQHSVWNSDVVQSQQHQQTSDVQIDAELARLETIDKQYQDKMAKLAKEEADAIQRWKSVEQTKSTVDQQKQKETCTINDLQRKSSQLEQKGRHLQETMKQQQDFLARNPQELQKLKRNAENRTFQVEQLARSEAELDATSTRVLGQMKKEVSQLTEETEKAQEVASTTRQVFDKIKTERSNAERTVKNKKELVDHSDKMIANQP